MTTDPPCPRRDKWFRGCRFEPRYDFGPAHGKYNGWDGPELTRATEASKARTYVADICVVCGKVVDRGGAR